MQPIKCKYGRSDCVINVEDDGMKICEGSNNIISFKWKNITWLEIPTTSLSSATSSSSTFIIPNNSPNSIPNSTSDSSSSSPSPSPSLDLTLTRSYSYSEEIIKDASKNGYVSINIGVVRKEKFFDSLFSSSDSVIDGGENFRIYIVKVIQDKAKEFIEYVRSKTCFHPGSESEKRPKVLILINPFGGRKLAPKIFKQIIPIFKWAKIEYEVVKTTHAGHAEEIGQTFDLDKYDVLATVSGDGLFHELLNGIMKRKDIEKAREKPLAIIPAGSGNALAQSLGLTDPYLAALAIVRGAYRKMDLMAVNDGEKIKYCFLSIAYAFTADCDMESEEYRWAGGARFTMAAVVRLLSLKRYEGIIKFLPAEKKMEIEKEVEEAKQKEGADAQFYHFGYEFENVPEYWEEINGDLTFFNVQNIPFISSDVCTAPFSSMNDGLLDIVYSQKPSKGDMISTFLSDLEDPKSFANDPNITHRKAKAVYFKPKNETGNLVLDGEKHKILPIKIEALPGAFTIICPEDVKHPLIPLDTLQK